MDKTKSLPAISPLEFIQLAFNSYKQLGYSVALWRLPDSSIIHLAAGDRVQQWADVTLEDARPGFLFAPFKPNDPKVFLPADELFEFESGKLVAAQGDHADALLAKHPTSVISRSRSFHVGAMPESKEPGPEAYMTMVADARELILQGRFEKVVPSRSKNVPLPDGFNLAETFVGVCTQYPKAMVSVFSSPITGTWMGATPELLVSVTRDQHFRTVAVAATQPFTGDEDLRHITWTQKDIEEQALVERYIISCFKKIRLREFDEHGPRTFRAGNVLHLKTEFDVDMTATHFPQLGSVMLKLLHPTSAVCGTPMEASLQFLLERENYDREYYSGYLGPVNIKQESHLYVNLRCMQLFEGQAILYAGAGVMSDSDPEKELAETEMKMNTLLGIIRQ